MMNQSPGSSPSTLDTILRRGMLVAAMASFLLFAYLIYGHVFSNGICCADDSTNAIVAKNLAFGKGYSNSVSFDGTPGLIPFDPNITTGPTLNVPAAAMIYIFGNQPWVPGFITATASLILLLGIMIALRHELGWHKVSLYLFLLLFCLYSMTAGLHFEQWYSLLGELPAALLCIAGAAVLARAPSRRSTILWSAALYGLAALTKLVALLSFAPVFVWLLWQVVTAKGHRNRRRFVVNFLGSLCALFLPFAGFELWKLAVLGFHSYLVSLSNLLVFIRFYSSGATAPSAFGQGLSPMQKCLAYAPAMYQHFGFSPLELLLVLAMVVMLVCYYPAEPRIRLYCLWLSGGALVYGVWWLLFSTGSPRYSLIGLSIYFAAVACVAFISLPRPIVGSIAVLVGLLFSSGYPRLVEPLKFVQTYKFGYTPRVVNLMKTAKLLEQLRPDEPFVMGWWATAGDVEYGLPTVDNFIRYDNLDIRSNNRQVILVRNQKWVDWYKIQQFEALEQRCNDILLAAPPYVVSKCPVERGVKQ